jgi:hypothetical protein
MSKEELLKRTARLPMVNGERQGDDGAMYRVKWLKPLPIDFDPEAHQYTWTPTGEVMSHSVTTILRAGKDPRTLQIFEDTKHIWAPRGTYVHSCLEQFLQGRPAEELMGGPYDDWVKPLLEYPLWETFEPIALEYSVCDLRRNIGGSLDVLGWDHLLDVMVLLDLKTLGRSSRTYSTHAQLGGYLSMLIDHHKLVVDECLTMWASKGEAHLGDRQSPTECLEKWEDAYDFWNSQQEVL